ncbi:MAG: hypothetical protein ING82_00320 [Roseomonas sp.]|nr:hypothetical protein [Roseomonas sp.]
MPLEPLRGEHALEAILFTVRLDCLINGAALMQSNARKSWEKELPARDTPIERKIEIGPTGDQRQAITKGFAFAHQRPDGTSTWRLSFLGPDITVESSLFTNWEKVKKRAMNYLRAALEVLEATRPGTNVIVFSLNLVHKFEYVGGDLKIQKFLTIGPFLMSGPLENIGFWHQHSGWYKNLDGIPILNQLNIDLQPPPTPEGVEENLSVSDGIIRVPVGACLRIQHIQESRFSTMPAATYVLNSGTLLEEFFEELYERHCQIMRQILTADGAALLPPRRASVSKS